MQSQSYYHNILLMDQQWQGKETGGKEEKGRDKEKEDPLRPLFFSEAEKDTITTEILTQMQNHCREFIKEWSIKYRPTLEQVRKKGQKESQGQESPQRHEDCKEIQATITSLEKMMDEEFGKDEEKKPPKGLGDFEQKMDGLRKKYERVQAHIQRVVRQVQKKSQKEKEPGQRMEYVQKKPSDEGRSLKKKTEEELSHVPSNQKQEDQGEEEGKQKSIKREDLQQNVPKRGTRDRKEVGGNVKEQNQGNLGLQITENVNKGEKQKEQHPIQDGCQGKKCQQTKWNQHSVELQPKVEPPKGESIPHLISTQTDPSKHILNESSHEYPQFLKELSLLTKWFSSIPKPQYLRQLTDQFHIYEQSKTAAIKQIELYKGDHTSHTALNLQKKLQETLRQQQTLKTRIIQSFNKKDEYARIHKQKKQESRQS